MTTTALILLTALLSPSYSAAHDCDPSWGKELGLYWGEHFAPIDDAIAHYRAQGSAGYVHPTEAGYTWVYSRETREILPWMAPLTGNQDGDRVFVACEQPLATTLRTMWRQLVGVQGFAFSCAVQYRTERDQVRRLELALDLKGTIIALIEDLEYACDLRRPEALPPRKAKTTR